MLLQPDLQWPVPMNWYRNTCIFSGFGKYVMTANDSLQFPAFIFNERTKSLTADSFQTAISIILSLLETEIS